jgi:RNA polymerase sigma factor (sigma-70 family)
MADINYIILESGEKVPVSEEILKYCERANEREKKREHRRLRRETSFDYMCEFGMELSVVNSQKSTEDMVLGKLMKEKLHEAVATLTKDEQILLNEIYFNRRTEREMAKMLNISQFGVNKRKNKILEKLRRILEK